METHAFFSSKIFSPILLLGKKPGCPSSRSHVEAVDWGHRISVQHVGCQTSPQFLVWYLIAVLLWTLVCSLLGIYLNISVKMPEFRVCLVSSLQVKCPSDFSACGLVHRGRVVLWLLGNRLFLTLCKLSPLLIPLVIFPRFCGSCLPPRLWQLPLWLSRFCSQLLLVYSRLIILVFLENHSVLLGSPLFSVPLSL